MASSRCILTVLALTTIGAVAAVPPAWADHKPSAQDKAETYAREGVDKLLRALDRLIETIPQYEMPVVDDNGDIIIRRKRQPEPPQPAPDPGAPDVDRTDT